MLATQQGLFRDCPGKANNNYSGLHLRLSYVGNGNYNESICKISFGGELVRNPTAMIHISLFLGHRKRTPTDFTISPLAKLLPTKANKTRNVKYTKDYEERKKWFANVDD